jgi:LacI family transcriptional regulator
MKRVTIADVAKEAGVVPSTVSYVLNGSRYVSPETKTAVLAAIDKLHYRRSSIAEGLRRGTMNTIGVFTKDTTSPFHFEIVKGIEEHLKGANYFPLITSTLYQGYEKDEQLVDMLVQRGSDALILVDLLVSEQKLHSLFRELPVVTINRAVEGYENHSILVDNYRSGYDATRKLIELGHSAIAHFVADADFSGSQQRLAGYRQALLDAGIAPNDDLIVYGASGYGSGNEDTRELMRRKVDFTAIFAGNDLVAYGILAELYQLHIRIPDRISVIGHDDYALSIFTTPPLTTMHTPLKEIGFAAAETALKLIGGETIQQQVFNSTLMERASVSAFVHA